MNLPSGDAWYFSRDGQQSGPLTYADLKEKADEGLLKPRTDLVWKEGMSDWVQIGQIDGLFERREMAPPPPEPDAASLEAALTAGDSQYSLGSFGGCRRRSFIFVHLILPALVVFLLSAVKTSFSGMISPDILAKAEMVGPVVLLILMVYTGIQRFANLGMSRWWYLAHFVPLLSFWTAYRSFACPEGYAVHKQMDGAGIFLAILYWLWLLSLVAIVTVFIAVLAGAAGSPEIQQHVKEFLEQLQAQTQAAPK
ncbi:GYF domain-containing protein [Luteolibacter sp. SL250]|uniref:GYF domain-containing protein n=1 Tax=Luteolibacter sp. SL250 TaxID=2995170 RepID=UPI002270B049|nr:GYF domain-containing protein [Luteolibacter sp. SL250]WAC19839.1 GYF domain-containing protein [Luteolibacter sp. SL250]